MDDYAVITIEGGSLAGDWYIPKTLVQYLTEDLGNSGSSTINLYKSIQSGNTNREHISIGALSQAVYHPSSGTSSYISGYTVTGYNLPAQVYRYYNLYSPILILLLGFLVVVRLMKQ